MPASTIFQAQGRARTLLDHLTVAQHFDDLFRPKEAARAVEDAEIWLALTADAMGYTVAKTAKTANSDPVDALFQRANALVLGGRL